MASMAAIGGFGEGIGQAMPNLLKLSGMQQQQNQFQEDMAMKNKTLIIAQDKAKQERNIMGYKERELAEKEAANNKLFDVEDFLISQGMPPEQVERSKKFVASTGLYETVNDKMKIKSMHVGNIFKMAKETPQFVLEMDQMENARLGKEINRLDEEMGKIKEQEPFTYPENKKYVTMHQNRVGLANKRSEVDSSINELKRSLAPAKVDTSISGAEFMALPLDDPRRINYMKGMADQSGKLQPIGSGGAYDPVSKKVIPPAARPGDEGKSQTEEQLTAKALKGDKEAQAILDAMQNRKIDIAGKGVEAKMKDIDIPGIAESIGDGRDARIAIKNAFGVSVSSVAQSEVLKKYPKFDFGMSDANYKWKQSSTNQRTINFAGGSLPRLERLVQQIPQNADVNTINRIMRTISVELGKPEYTDYESNRNAIAQEINTALSGSSTGSDYRVKIEIENLKSARSPQQIHGSIVNLREALIARLDVDLSPIYPIEVVRGEKTMEQYKKELYSKYRGNYNPSGASKETDGITVDPEKVKKGW